jgi:hypothetical protein
MEMSDKLQFVAGFHHSSGAESHDKLKFVGHFWIRQRYHTQSQSTPNRNFTLNSLIEEKIIYSRHDPKPIRYVRLMVSGRRFAL